MVAGTDTGNMYAVQAERYYDVPDEEPTFCGACSEWTPCPDGCGYGLCDWFGEFKREDEGDGCGAYEPREEVQANGR